MGDHSLFTWIAFYAVVFAMLMFDLFVAHRKDEKDGFWRAMGFTGLWIAIALAFGGYVWVSYGAESAAQYYTGYFIEKALSVDNLFMFILIFRVFMVKPEYQHRVLFWGVFGAFAIRGAFIGGGNWLVSQFEPLIYIFAAMLIWGGFKVFGDEDDEEPANEEEAAAKDAEKRKEFEDSWYVKLAKRYLPFTEKYHGHSFFVKESVGGAVKWVATPLFLVLLAVEVTDVAFAVDSIPAILVISKDPFILITSNVMAILGLRALYSVLNSIMPMFRFLKYGISIVLLVVGLKMLEFGLAPTKYALDLVENFPNTWVQFAILGGVVALLAWFMRESKKSLAIVGSVLGGIVALIGGLHFFGVTAESVPTFHVPTLVSLGIVLGTLTLSVVLSVLIPEKKDDAAPQAK